MTDQIDSRVIDHAKEILQDALVNSDDRIALWDEFHTARTSTELAARLQQHFDHVDPELVSQLIEKKRLTDPEPESQTPVQGAIARVKTISPDVLELAEKHPNVLRALVDEAERLRD